MCVFMKIIDDINKIGRNKWNEFVKEHPQGTIFQTYEMFGVYKNTPHNRPIAVAVVDDETVLGVMLSVLMWNGNAISKMISARSIIIGGPLVINNNENVLKLLIQGYRKLLPVYTIYSEIRPIYCMDSISDSLKCEGFKRKGHYNLTLDIIQDEQLLWMGMHKERQRNVKHAEKVGLQFKEVVDEESIDGIVNMIRYTYKRKRVPMVDFDIFLEAQKALREHISFFAAYYEGKVIAGQIRLCYKDLVYAWFAGSDDNYFKQRPNDFLMWNVICWSHDKGYKLFDFGGGGEPGVPYGVRDYKLKYGCQMFDYGRFQLFHRPLAYKVGEFVINKIIKR